MKLLKYSIPTIDIEIDIREKQDTQIAATFQIEHKSSISKKYRISDKIKDRYGAIIESAMETISTFPELHIDNPYQSNESYTVYIPVTCDAIQKFMVKFRLHDHSRDNILPPTVPDDIAMHPKIVVYIKDIRMNGEAISNEVEMLSILRDICEGLSHGDVQPLMDLVYDK